ncbi:hypothetical protein P8452_54521 [Trifolium repens]|nr:hypothetical protein P8452_54521 [Trifolium repens]
MPLGSLWLGQRSLNVRSGLLIAVLGANPTFNCYWSAALFVKEVLSAEVARLKTIAKDGVWLRCKASRHNLCLRLLEKALLYSKSFSTSWAA